MKHLKLASFLIAAFICMNTLSAQTDQEDQITPKTIANNTRSNWAFGFGLNILDDSGGNLGGIFDSEISHFTNPFVISIEYFASSKLSVNASVSFNEYKVGKLVDSWEIQESEEPNYVAIDLALRYSFRDLLNIPVIDPYLQAGLGHTRIGRYTTVKEEIPATGRLTLNAGLGSNFWISNAWAINLNYMLKYGVVSGDKKDFISNQTQLSFGILHRFPK